MNPIQCDDPDCLFELECDTCPTGFHMVHVKRPSQMTLDAIEPPRRTAVEAERRDA